MPESSSADYQMFESLSRQLSEIQRELSALSARVARVESTSPANTTSREETAPITTGVEPVVNKPAAVEPPLLPERSYLTDAVKVVKEKEPVPLVRALIPEVPPATPVQVVQAAEAYKAVIASQPSATSPEPKPSPWPDTPAPPPRKSLGDWENLVGGQWALWAGSLALFLSVACFLAYTWNSLSPGMRFSLGLATGLTMVGGGVYSRARAQHWFSEGLCGVGLAVLYLSVWAGAQRFGLLSFGLAFTSMAGITTLGVFLGLRFNAQSLCLMAALGGFKTPLLLHGMPDSGGVQSGAFSLLTYIAVLDAGILAVSLFKRWNALTWLSFCASILLVVLWGSDNYKASLCWPLFAYLTVYFLLFTATASFHSLLRRVETLQTDLLLLFASAAVYSYSAFVLIQENLGSAPGTFPLALAAFYGCLCFLVSLSAGENKKFTSSAGGLALLFLTVAVPVQWRRDALVVGWCVEAAMLIILGSRLKASLVLAAGQIVWFLSVGVLFVSMLQSQPEPHVLFFNGRALPLLVSVACTALTVVQGWSLRRAAASDAVRDEFSFVYAAYTGIAGAWLLGQETYLWFSWHKLPGAMTWQAGAAYSMAALLAVYATLCYAIGKWQDDKSIRLTALCVLLASAALPFWTGTALANSGWPPFWNLRSLAYAVIALAIAVTSHMAAKCEFADGDSDARDTQLLSTGLFILLGISVEVYFAAARWHLPPHGNWHASALFLLVMLWGLGSAAFRIVSRGSLLGIVGVYISWLATLAMLTGAVSFGGLVYTPVGNLRVLAFAVMAISLVTPLCAPLRSRSADSSAAWLDFVSPVGASCLLLWGATQEAYNVGHFYKGLLGQHWTAATFFFITVLWSLTSLAMIMAGLKWRHVWFRYAGYLVVFLNLVHLVFLALTSTRLDWTPIDNARFIAFLASTFASSVAAFLLAKYRDDLFKSEREWIAFFTWAAFGALLWGLTQEVYEACYFHRLALGGHWNRWAQVAISLVWSLYGASLLITGINRARQHLRLAALALLAFTACKVFVFDLSFLDGPARVLSLGGLGVSLIFISWLYGRFGSVRKQEEARHETVVPESGL